MAYDTAVPNASESPGLFPAQANDNFARLKTIIGSNHKFNDSAATDDGYHQNVKLLPIATPGNDATIGQLFVDSSNANNELYHKNANNVVWQVTPCLPMRAWVSFGPGSPGVILNSGNAKYNVTQISKQGTGIYQIQFTSALPSIYYNWSLSTIPTSSSTGVIVTVRTSSNYGDYVKTTSLDITVRLASTGAATDGFVAVNAIIWGG